MAMTVIVNGTNQNLTVSGEFLISSNAAFRDGVQDATVNIGTGELVLTNVESAVELPRDLAVKGTEQFCCVSLSSSVCESVSSASVPGVGRLVGNGSGEKPFVMHLRRRNYWHGAQVFPVEWIGDGEESAHGDSCVVVEDAAGRDEMMRVASDFNESFSWSSASMSDDGRWSGRDHHARHERTGADIWDELLLLSSTATATEIRVADASHNGVRYTGLRTQTHGGHIAYDNSADSVGRTYETLLVTSADGSAGTLDWSSGVMGRGPLERCG